MKAWRYKTLSCVGLV